MAGAHDAEPSIKVVQVILTMHNNAPGTNLVDAVDTIVTAKMWRGRSSPAGGHYEAFGDFAVDHCPHGLGVDCSSSFKMMRFALLQNCHYREYTDLLDCCVRSPGRPPNTLVGDDGFNLAVSTSRNSLDRILLTLKRKHPVEFDTVCKRQLTPREAARRIGLLPSEQRREFGVCDLAVVGTLTARAQGRLLVKLFEVVGIDAQCTLVSRAIEPLLGHGLAQRWRELASASSTSSK
jgi:hypothetical protein